MNYQNLKCSELKDLLAKRGLPSHGKKNELLDRLLKHEEEEKAKAAKKDPVSSKQETITEDKNKKNIEKKNADMTPKKAEKEKKTKNLLHEEELLDQNKVEQLVLNNKENFNKDLSKRFTDDTKDKSDTFGKHAAVLKGKENSSSILQNKQEKNIEINDKNYGKKEKTTIPKIIFSESSLSSTSKIEKNVVTIGGNNNLTEPEKRELRKKRFGIVSKDEILESRAKRFSIVTKKMEDENKRKRAERFGLNLSSLNDPETKKRRAERFGLFPEIQPSRMEERKIIMQHGYVCHLYRVTKTKFFI